MCLSPLLLWHLLDLTISATKHYLVDTFLVLGVQNWALYPDGASLGTEQGTLIPRLLLPVQTRMW